MRQAVQIRTTTREQAKKISLLLRENEQLKDQLAYLMTLQPCGQAQDIGLGIAFSNKHSIKLTNVEARIMNLLLRTKVVFNEQLLTIWAATREEGFTDNIARQYVYRLRKKLAGVAVIENYHGIGYSLKLCDGAQNERE